MVLFINEYPYFIRTTEIDTIGPLLYDKTTNRSTALNYFYVSRTSEMSEVFTL